MIIYISERYGAPRSDVDFICDEFPVWGHADLNALSPDTLKSIIFNIRKFLEVPDSETIEEYIENELSDVHSAADELAEYLKDTDPTDSDNYDLVENDKPLADSISYLLYGEPVYLGM